MEVAGTFFNMEVSIQFQVFRTLHPQGTLRGLEQLGGHHSTNHMKCNTQSATCILFGD